MLRTSSFPPRGMTRSMYLSCASREDISEREETDWIKVDGREVDESALAMRDERSVAVSMDSLPPLRIAELPENRLSGLWGLWISTYLT